MTTTDWQRAAGWNDEQVSNTKLQINRQRILASARPKFTLICHWIHSNRLIVLDWVFSFSETHDLAKAGRRCSDHDNDGSNHAVEAQNFSENQDEDKTDKDAFINGVELYSLLTH